MRNGVSKRTPRPDDVAGIARRVAGHPHDLWPAHRRGHGDMLGKSHSAANPANHQRDYETTMRLRPLPISASIALALLVATSACQKQETATPGDTPAATTQASTAEADAKFADLSKRWLDGWLEQQPVSATQTGKHDFDDR